MTLLNLKKRHKSIISICLALLMVFSMLGTLALADGETALGGQTVVEQPLITDQPPGESYGADTRGQEPTPLVPDVDTGLEPDTGQSTGEATEPAPGGQESTPPGPDLDPGLDPDTGQPPGESPGSDTGGQETTPPGPDVDPGPGPDTGQQTGEGTEPAPPDPDVDSSQGQKPEQQEGEEKDATTEEEKTDLDSLPLLAMSTLRVDPIQVAGTANDSFVIMQGNNTAVSLDDSWEIQLTTGTLRGTSGADLTSDIDVSGLPAGLTFTAENSGTNRILVTLAGTAAPALTADASVAVTVKGTAVSEPDALDSEPISTTVRYNPLTTFIISNEEGGIIDQLISDGYGDDNLYEALVALEPGSGGVITEEFMDFLASCPGDSEIFTAPLTSFSPDVNNPIGINSDGTLIVAQILGSDYYGDTGYSTYPDSPSATKLFTYAASPQYYIDAGSLLIDGQVRYYKAFAIAWSPSASESTTFVLSNEEGGLIDQLIEEGYGNSSLYGALVALEPGSGGVISEQFLETLASCPAESDIFTAPLTDFADPSNNPIGINSDGTLIVAPIFGRSFHGQTGYSTYPDNPSASKLFTCATSPQYYIDAGANTNDGVTHYYKAFAVAWSPTTATTFVLSNEEGGLIDQLIAEGYGDSNLYEALAALQDSSGGVITDEFMDTLGSCPAGSEIFTAKLSDVVHPANNPIGINSDGTLIVVPIYAKDYHGKTGYATYPDSSSATKLFTYATSSQYYIDAGSSNTGGASYQVFAIAWAPGGKVAGKAIDTSVTMAPGNSSVSTDSTWEIEVTSGTLKGSAGDDLSSDLNVTGLPSGLTWTAMNNGSNKVLLTVSGTAAPAVSGRATVSVVVKSSAVSDGATDSDTVSLYVHPTRRYPIALAVNQNTNTIYVANKGSLDVTVMDGATDTVKATISAGTYPRAIAVNPDTNKVYVTNQQDKTVMVIDGATNALIATLPTGTYPVDLDINRGTNKIYVANNSSKNVTVIDGETDTVVGTVTAGNSPYDLAVNQNTNRVYSANNYDKTVSVIDGGSDTLITNLTSDTGPYAVALNETTNRIYVTNLKNIITGENGTVTVIDGATNTVSSSITVGVKPRAIAVNPATNRVYVANLDNDSVMVIDGISDTIAATITVGDGPLALGINLATNKIYVANCGDNTVTVIDGATNNTGSVAAGDYPCVVAVNEVSDKAYIANQYSDFLTIIASLPPIPPAAPTIDPNGGDFTTSVQVTITGSGGTVFYTTDGTDPTTSSTRTEYTAPFTLTSSSTVKAAIQNGSIWSEVTSADFTVSSEALTFILSNEEGGLIDELIGAGYGTCNLYQGLVGLAPASNGVISENFLDTLANCPRGSQIFTQKFNEYAGLNGGIAVNTDGTAFTTTAIKGRDYHGDTGYSTYPPSQTGQERELFTYANDAGHYIDAVNGSTTYKVFAIAWSMLAAPTISPDGGTYNDSVQVTIAGSGGDIYYTTDGSDPTVNGTRTEYTAPFTLTHSATVKAAVQNGTVWSDVTTEVFTINTGSSTPAAPTITPDGGTFPDSVEVAISSISGTIYYTLDGTDPTSSGTKIQYMAKFTLTQSATVKAAVHGESLGWSGITRADFTINHTPPQAPVIGPDSGTFAGSVEVTITGSGGTIFYTTDGTDPTESGTRIEYTVPFTLNQSATVRATVQGEHGWSEVVSEAYTIGNLENPVPVITPDGGTFTGSQPVTIGFNGGTNPDPGFYAIFYTTDGSDPKDSGSVYTGGITLTQTTTVKARVRCGLSTVAPVLNSVDAGGGGGTIEPLQYTWSDIVSATFTKITTTGGGGGGGGGSTPKPKEEVKPPVEPEVTAPTEAEPTDLAGHWAHDCVMALLQHGIIKGYPDQTIRPKNEITRAEAAALLVAALELQEYQPQIESPYTDELPAWAKKAVLTATEKHLMKGYPDGTFRPDQKITRAEMCAALMQAFPKSVLAGFVLDFTDSGSIPDWAKGFIESAVSNGVVSGYPDRTFQPGSNIKRGEAFSIICRLMGYHSEHNK